MTKSTLLAAYRGTMKGEAWHINNFSRMYRVWHRTNKDEGLKEVPDLDKLTNRMWRRDAHMMFSRMGGHEDLASECI